MGYSEVYCHICGVSLNMGRIRTPSEPRSYAWHHVRSHGDNYPTFVNGGSTDCGRSAGCMLVYREDKAERMKRRHGEHHGQSDKPSSQNEACHQDDDENDDEDFTPDKMIMEKLCKDDDFNATNNNSALQKFTAFISSILDSSASNSSSSDDNVLSVQHFDPNQAAADTLIDTPMDYEFESPPESCSEYSSDPDGELGDTPGADEEEIYYQDFRRDVAQQSQFGGRLSPEEEIMLPLFRPLEGRDQDAASVHGSDSSFECDEPEDSHEWGSAHLDHHHAGKHSHYGHPLTTGMDSFSRDCLWEHIAGPGCLNTDGYNGTRISEQEMRYANTLQCLVQRGDAGREGWGDEVPHRPSWEPESDDEPWEGESAWFLSGISDHMPSRDMDIPTFVPQRHGREHIHAENTWWDEDSDPRYAMPFHPSCFEVYKRAALKRHGTLNIDLLGSWWKLSARHDSLHDFPRVDAVQRGREQSWQHNLGDEFLAADPLFLPGLRDVITSAEVENTGMLGEDKMTVWDTLPTEISTKILGFLDAVDIAKVSLVYPSLVLVAKPMIRKDLEDRLCLWELGSPRPYYQWTGVTAWELQRVQQEYSKRESELQSVLEILNQEGCNEAHDLIKQQWDHDSEARRNVALALLQEKLPLRIPIDELDIARFAVALEEASANGKLKGLQNRTRIWKDCEAILDQIEELQCKGDILPNGQLRLGAKLYQNVE